MASELLSHIANITQKSSEELIAAIESLPSDKLAWSVDGKGRSALDQAAECALMNSRCIDLLNSRAWPEDFSMDDFVREKANLASDWSSLKTALQDNTIRLAAAIRDVPPEDVAQSVAMPWGAMSVADVAAYPSWNMAYHQGQITFIKQLL